MWLVFVAFLVLAVVVSVLACASLRDDKLSAEWVRDMALGHMAEYGAGQTTVLSHVAADGELLEFPIIRGESLVSLATTLGEIAALPEVAA